MQSAQYHEKKIEIFLKVEYKVEYIYTIEVRELTCCMLHIVLVPARSHFRKSILNFPASKSIETENIVRMTKIYYNHICGGI